MQWNEYTEWCLLDETRSLTKQCDYKAIVINKKNQPVVIDINFARR